MNLRAIANRATSRVNPNVAATLKRSIGWTTDAAYHRTPAYAAPETITVQAQALTKEDIKHLDALNMSAAELAIYANTQLGAVDRTTGTGGDIVTFGGAPVPPALQNSTWLVTAILEGWTTAGWCKAALTRQMPA